ncbi:MSMEG_0570 family nitrogen starvation response protein [Pseudanabaena sp. Chao 1811]|uniref:MSMEG_0570 family nitrogen starvation response protein n=1 Tax=Pseudanabaena sp. Chao 1811 TaxID=2963092 RepID=UPI0022F3EF6C|nr:MSMEG_0570 family nitrogen starvation response protein [Pseudanabaena sp. Chao 1811]
MPQINFQISWPDGSEQTCYSPSLIVKEYFEPNVEYALDEFVESARTALNIASDRVKAKYGFPCGLAIGQLQDIEARASEYQNLENPQVKFIRFIE